MNQTEFECLVSSGTVGELKNALAFLRSEHNALSRDFLRKEKALVDRQKRIVEALARRQEEALK